MLLYWRKESIEIKTRIHLKNRILVQGRGSTEFQTAGPPEANRGFETRH
jgi:hypothetical protein